MIEKNLASTCEKRFGFQKNDESDRIEIYFMLPVVVFAAAIAVRIDDPVW